MLQVRQIQLRPAFFFRLRTAGVADHANNCLPHAFCFVAIHAFANRTLIGPVLSRQFFVDDYDAFTTFSIIVSEIASFNKRNADWTR